MVIKNGLVFQENKGFVPLDIYIEDGYFSALKQHNGHIKASSQEETVDAAGCYVIPGLIDIHFHGCMGYDFCDGTPEALDAISRYQFENGVLSICPASMTLPESELTKICKNANDWAIAQADAAGSTDGHSRLIGINLEGPFISYEKKGAQNPDYIVNASLTMLHHLNEASGGLIRLLTIAPETRDALSFIKKVHDSETFQNIHLSLGHSTSDYETARKAFAAGADHVTHLFNAMPPLNHREPGMIGAAFDTKHCYAEMICDGVHIAPSVVRAAFAMFTDERITLISDSMMATGLTDGAYTLGGLDVNVLGKYARLSDGTIAGSATNLMDCMRTAVSMGIPLESAVKCASINPARSIGMEKELGSIEAGKLGDCVILDKDLKIIKIIKGGR